MLLQHLLTISMLVICSACVCSKKTNTHLENFDMSCDPNQARKISLEYSKDLEFNKSFVKAASGLVLKNNRFYIIQDSSRYLAEISQDLNGPIVMHALASKEVISKNEDPKKPYLGFRKDRKADFEAATLLPDGRILILGSGYDAQKIGSPKSHYKNIGVLFNTDNKNFETLSLETFYKHLLNRSDVVGGTKDGIAPRLNIEGVTVIEGKEIAFFHRSNYNKNFHDSMIIYNLNAWLQESKKSEWTLKEKSIRRLDFGFVEHEGQKFPITLNDASYSEGYLYIPLACETDTIVDGKDIDGEVVWTGLAKISLDKNKECKLFQFTDKKMAKIEGITPDLDSKNRFFAVHDVDSEDHASQISAVKLPTD